MLRYAIFVVGSTLGILNAGPAVQSQTQASGVSLAYAVPARITLFEPVIVKVTVSNSRSEPIAVDLGKNYIGHSQLTLTRPDGSSVLVDPSKPDQRKGHEVYVDGRMNVEPGRPFAKEVILNEWFDFAVEGGYRLEIAFVGTVQSSTVGTIAVQRESVLPIQVLPRNESVLRQTCDQLVKQVQTTTSAEEAILAARKLTYVRDVIGVESLGRVVLGAKVINVDSIAIAGLRENGSLEARNVLLQLAGTKAVQKSGPAVDALNWLDRKQH